MTLRETLRLRLDGARRVAVLAVGSRLRADDEAGLLVADALETLTSRVGWHGQSRLCGMTMFDSAPSGDAVEHGHPGASRKRDASEVTMPPSARISLSVFVGETTPENLTGEIRAYGPSHVVIADAADLGQEPGTVEVVPPDAPTLGTTASTHSLPLEVLANYLRTSVGCDVVILGIQPASLEYGRPPCLAVRLAARRAAEALLAALKATVSTR